MAPDESRTIPVMAPESTCATTGRKLRNARVNMTLAILLKQSFITRLYRKRPLDVLRQHVLISDRRMPATFRPLTILNPATLKTQRSVQCRLAGQCGPAKSVPRLVS